MVGIESGTVEHSTNISPQPAVSCSAPPGTEGNKWNMPGSSVGAIVNILAWPCQEVASPEVMGQARGAGRSLTRVDGVRSRPGASGGSQDSGSALRRL